MEPIIGNLSSPFSIPPTHFSSKLTFPRLAVSDRCSSLLGLSSGKNPFERGHLASRAKKKKDGRGDADGYGPIPGKNESFFPEAVLLKKKKSDGGDAVQPEFADAEEEQLLEFLNIQLESEVKLERPRHYEVVFLIHEVNFQEVSAVVEKVKNYITEKKGKIWRLNDWGMRKLAYKIKKAKMANYILMNFEIEAGHINEFKTMLDRDERVIRHLVIKRDEAITEDCPPPPEFRPSASSDDDDDDEDDELDDDVELQMDDYDGEDDFRENIIFVDEEEEADDDAQESRKTNPKKKIGVSSRS